MLSDYMFSPQVVTANQLSALTIKNGQIVCISDNPAFYYDFGNKRYALEPRSETPYINTAYITGQPLTPITLNNPFDVGLGTISSSPYKCLEFIFVYKTSDNLTYQMSTRIYGKPVTVSNVTTYNYNFNSSGCEVIATWGDNTSFVEQDNVIRRRSAMVRGKLTNSGFSYLEVNKMSETIVDSQLDITVSSLEGSTDIQLYAIAGWR